MSSFTEIETREVIADRLRRARAQRPPSAYTPGTASSARGRGHPSRRWGDQPFIETPSRQ